MRHVEVFIPPSWPSSYLRIGWGGKLKGSDRYNVNQPGLSEGMRYRVSLKFCNAENTSRETKEGMRSFKWIDKHSMSMTNNVKGSGASGISAASDIG